MTTTNANERDHALDATRAFALLLGVVFHAAWSFVPFFSGAPIIDNSSNHGFGWFFFASHTFRMQLFFLIAGFFARLVFLRKHYIGFTKHRFIRIVIPFVIGWFLLIPMLILLWVWGGNVSGKNLVPVPLNVIVDLMFAQGKIFVVKSAGGMFTLGHLWFLYYLIWMYILVILARFLILQIMPKQDFIKGKVDAVVAKLMKSSWTVLLLAIVFGAMLFFMKGWFGVDTPTNSLFPNLAALSLYGSFFVFGWILNRQADLLRATPGRWKWQIPVAIVLTIPLYLSFYNLQQGGVTNSSAYPWLAVTDISNWDEFLSELKSGAHENESKEIRIFRNQMLQRKGLRRLIQSLSDNPSQDVRAGVCDLINKRLLVNPNLFADLRDQSSREESLGIGTIALENRHSLEKAFPGLIAGNPTNTPWYYPMKFVYSVGYALVVWLLVLGTLGAFQDLFPTHNAAWRYVADSSYWVYLAHLPVVVALQIVMSAWPLPSPIKFPIMILMSAIVLFGSYHLLVRSTYIGWLLNGRRYPLILWPKRKTLHTQSDESLPQVAFATDLAKAESQQA